MTYSKIIPDFEPCEHWYDYAIKMNAEVFKCLRCKKKWVIS
jgi:hypothetical protein